MHFLPGGTKFAQRNHRAPAKPLRIQVPDAATFEGQQALNWYVVCGRNYIQQFSWNALTVVQQRANLHQLIRYKQVTQAPLRKS